MKTLRALLLAGLLGAHALPAADFFLLPAGAGLKDGTSWGNAFARESLDHVVNDRMRPGDRVLIGGGVYPGMTLSVKRGGSPNASKTILGVDRGDGLPVFAGDWVLEQPAKGATAVRIEPGASHLRIENLRIEGYERGIYAPEVKAGVSRSGLIFRNVDMQQFRYGFVLSDCDDMQLIDCDLKRYTKHAFRFEQGCDRVRLAGCVADCTGGDAEWEKSTELFPFGFDVNGNGSPNTSFAFEDCVALNNRMRFQRQAYKNGDGFVVEANAADVSFRRCRSIRNQDGGFDLKVRNVRLDDCVAIGNYRGYRVWTTGTLKNCFAGWGTVGLWSNQGPVQARSCTFYAMLGAAVQTGEKAVAPVTLSDGLITTCKKFFQNEAGGEVRLESTITVEPGHPANEPRFVNPDPAWDGVGGAMDSRAFPGKGYRSVGG